MASSRRLGLGATHVNFQIELSREQNVDYFLNTIIEGPHDWPVRPVAEIFYESDVWWCSIADISNRGKTLP